VRVISSVLSCAVPIAPSIGLKKLGQPVPDSYFVSEVNSGWSQPAQTKVPLRFSAFSGLVRARSVPCYRSTRYCSGVSRCFHSASE
jgi:hypothetical protein